MGSSLPARRPEFGLSALVLLGTFIEYGVGWSLLLLRLPPPNDAASLFSPAGVLGLVLLTHSLVYATYYYHELAHALVTGHKRTDDALAQLLSWLNGSCYFDYYELQRQHLDHHRNKRDVVMVPRDSFLYTNRVVWGVCWWAEYLYVPAWHLAVAARAMLAPWWSEARSATDRRRTLVVSAVRFGLGAYLVFARGKWAAVLAYCVAYCLAIHVSRIADIFGHLYDVVPIGSAAPASPPDKLYDMQHTFSIYNMSRYCGARLQGLLNALLFLNFTHHNAHHFSTSTPWHALPRVNLHALVSEASYSLDFWAILRQYHLHRTDRLRASSDPGVPRWDDARKRWDLSEFFGEAEASMLVIEV